MSPDKAGPEVPVGGEHGFRRRLASISASVLLITAGAFAYYHNASEIEASLAASVSGLRRPRDRRLPHYTTYGGTSYDFAGQNKEVGGCCCTTTEEAMGVKRLDSEFTCNMKFKGRVEYNPTMPPMQVPEYNPTMPPLFDNYNPTRPPADYNPTRPPVFPGHTMVPGDGIGDHIEDVKALWEQGFKGCCCSHEVITGEHSGEGFCEVGFLSRDGTWVR